MKQYISHIALCFCFLFASTVLGAQESASSGSAVAGIEEVSSAGIEQQIDSTLYGKDIFSAIPESVVVRQKPAIRSALAKKIQSDDPQMSSGFRIRIFIDNRRNAREASLEVLRKFNEMYPFISVYRTYSAPNFKVTVGNFRNRVEAEKLLAEIKDYYPDAFIVREKFKYPSIGDADTRSLEELYPQSGDDTWFSEDGK